MPRHAALSVAGAPLWHQRVQGFLPPFLPRTGMHVPIWLLLHPRCTLHQTPSPIGTMGLAVAWQSRPAARYTAAAGERQLLANASWLLPATKAGLTLSLPLTICMQLLPSSTGPGGLHADCHSC